MKRCLVSLLCATIMGSAHAGGFGSLGSLGQDEFHRLAQDMGAVISYKGVVPATPLGMAGFDAGIEVTDTRLQDARSFAVAGTSTSSHVVIPKLHVHKGLLGGFDIGAFVGGARDIDATLFGVDVRYAILDDTLATPAFAVRASATRATGTGELRSSTAAVDAMLSKRLTALTPYVGAGVVRIMAKADGTPLSDEKFNKSRLFGGLNVNLVAVNFALEVERLAGNTSISAKAGLRF